MKREVAVVVALSASVMFAAAQPAKESYEPGLGEFMTATQLRHAKLWFAGTQNNWDLAAYEIDDSIDWRGRRAISSICWGRSPRRGLGSSR